MEPALIINKKISFKEIRVKAMQKNIFSCPVFAFLGAFWRDIALVRQSITSTWKILDH
jgi:hypothetical protein